MIRILFILNFFLIAFFLGLHDCSSLEEGSFEIYENDSMVGHIYRKRGWQIEKYLNGQGQMIATIKSEGCLFYMKSYRVKEDLDTITWAVSYKKIANNHYSFVGSPKYLKIDYLLN